LCSAHNMSQLICTLIFISVLVHLVALTSLDCPQGFIAQEQTSTTTVLEKEELTVSTFNTYWLFNETRSVSYWPWRNQDELDEHHANIMHVFSTLNSDLINIVEVSEDCSFLYRLVQGSSLSQSNHNVFAVKGTDTATKQNVALISPHATNLVRSEMRWDYPLPHSTCGYCKCDPNAKPSTTGVSKHYFARYNFRYHQHDEQHWFPLLVVGVHFKAIPTDPPSCAKREAQASVIVENARLIINGMKEEYPDKTPSVIVMGDFNDYDDSILDRNSNVPTSQTLRILRDGLNLTNVVRAIDEQQNRYSHWWDSNDNLRIDKGELSLLDHILISDHMQNALTEVKIHSHDLYPNGSLTVSDHWPVSITLDLPRLSQTLFELDISGKVYRCDQETSLSPNACSSNGKCVLDGRCECKPGYLGDQCNIESCNGLPATHKHVCFGRGDCVAPDTCNCTDPMYSGQFCQEKTFSECFGVAEFSPEVLVCSGHGQCVSDNKCQCTSGFAGEKCDRPICFELVESHPQVCSGHGNCIAPEICHCARDWAGSQCEISIKKDESGTVPENSVLYTQGTVITAIVVSILSTTLFCSACFGVVMMAKSFVTSLKGGGPAQHRTLVDEEFEMKSDDESEPTVSEHGSEL